MDLIDKNNIIDYRIKKSKQAKDDAKLALDNHRLSTAMNRIYYAIFYIVSALAMKYDFSTSKHKQLMGWFNINFVKKGIVDINLWKSYKNAYDKRQESDYDDFVEISLEDVTESYNEMLSFISRIEELIFENRLFAKKLSN